MQPLEAPSVQMKTFWKFPLAGLGWLQLFQGGDEVRADKGPLSLDLEEKSALKKKEICAGVVAAKA